QVFPLKDLTPMTARTKKAASRQARTAKAAAVEAVRRGPSRIAGYFDAEGLIVIDRVADRFGVSKAQLADTMGVSPETFHRAARAKAPKTQG
ncbi:antitoxin Xre-like helix-turn-helix domain-containing protein, partial [Escherichia coli]|uniref:antitoxin Xre-like helix-turn-helix domain-containing protein n=1 Tax=Escherichia coli TaxID=562 RepID=UPI0028E052AE